ncbi:MAG TPA: 4,5-DOPA dioxygenase extradiol [Bacteroidales bacterium]|nr:4,5-DOPA dioxygenase extradiol [Bacteroidales bacterium]
MKPGDLNRKAGSPGFAERMPVLFVGHGSPMNAIEENEFTAGWRAVAKTLPRPRAILCISAHWETRGTFLTAMEQPQTIHDFGGFPKELFEVQYPAPGSPGLAKETRGLLTGTEAELDTRWGLDHGTWSILKHLYPGADVPVIEMSLNYYRSPKEHYALAKELSPLRKEGVLIIGSGNMVHNLRMVAWERMKEPGFGYDWALEANDRMKKFILAGDHPSLANYSSLGSAFRLAIPTPDHFLPLLYVLALQEDDEVPTFFNDQPVMGSLTMTSVRIAGG